MEKSDIVKARKYSRFVVIGVVALILIFNSVGTVGAGERGIILQFGAVKDNVFGEGLYFKIPFAQKVVRIDVKIKKDEVPATASSKDLQIVTSRMALSLPTLVIRKV